MPLGLALASWFLFAPAHHAGDKVDNRRIGVWTVQTRTDGFSGARSCRLFAKQMEYGRGAVVFRFSDRTDTTTAVYRVDDGPAVDAGSELLEMARRGFAVYDDSLPNPTGGLVRVPEARLAGARAVSIRPNPRANVATFRMDGLGDALAAARSAGCLPAS